MRNNMRDVATQVPEVMENTNEETHTTPTTPPEGLFGVDGIFWKERFPTVLSERTTSFINIVRNSSEEQQEGRGNTAARGDGEDQRRDTDNTNHSGRTKYSGNNNYSGNSKYRYSSCRPPSTFHKLVFVHSWTMSFQTDELATAELLLGHQDLLTSLASTSTYEVGGYVSVRYFCK
ncbi:hypothetical protein ANN_06960 [Periplaneta americana]|uniref:Uncharacterized protein n=1 Tax=Periplaneta americana TaxID=6978 RepID=A0ABQ8TGY1_PERAM|nr:hypothetical protein ANN_06960 [Periplaneta americana]